MIYKGRISKKSGKVERILSEDSCGVVVLVERNLVISISDEETLFRECIDIVDSISGESSLVVMMLSIVIHVVYPESSKVSS